MPMLRFNLIIPGLNSIFLFTFVIIHYHSQNLGKIKFQSIHVLVQQYRNVDHNKVLEFVVLLGLTVMT